MPRAGLTAERLVAAAGEMADRNGFDTVTLSELARHFGVRPASLYAHLRNSEDLKTRLALHALALLAESAEEAVAGRAGQEALFALADCHRDFALHHPGLFQASRHPLDPETAAESKGRRLAWVIEAVLRGYPVPDSERVHAIRLIGSVFLGFPTLEGAGSFGHSVPEPSVSWRRSLEALDALLKAWPTT